MVLIKNKTIRLILHDLKAYCRQNCSDQHSMVQLIGHTQRSTQQGAVWKNAQVICGVDAKVVHRGRLGFQQKVKELLDISMQNARNFRSQPF